MLDVKEELNIYVKEEDLEYLFTIKRKQQHSKNCINNSFDDVYLLYLDVDVEHAKLQRSELSEIKYFEFKNLEKLYKMKDPSLVPYCKEHKKLFKILHKKIK